MQVKPANYSIVKTGKWDVTSKVGKIIITLMVLTLSWLLWSGLYKPIVLGLGVFSCVTALYLAHRIDFFGRDVFSLHLGPRLPRFWGWLLTEIAKSSYDVARIVLDPKLPISPTIVQLDDTPTDLVGQAILGNAITLTPGTVTLDIVDGRLTAHCLTRAGADELLTGEMSRRATALTGN